MATDLDREQWHRQLLQRDEDISVEATVERAAGLYSTAPTAYLSCTARIPGFVADDLDRALYRDRTLVRMGALRGSGFLIPIDRVDAVASASERNDWHEGAVVKLVGEDRRDRWQRQILDILDGRVLPAREIREEMGVSSQESEALRFLLSSLTDQRLVAAASGTGSWRDNRYGYALWDQWLPDRPARVLDPGKARAEIARWYLQGHGPASVEDFAWWGGLKKVSAREALEVVAEESEGLYDIAGMVHRSPPSGLRLLPIWDTAMVTQKSRRRMVAEDLYPYVYDASGNLTSTIVLDGEVVGVWDRGGKADHLEVRACFFSGSGPMAEVEDEAAVIASAVGATDLEISFVDTYVDLTQASWNRFMSPLKGS